MPTRIGKIARLPNDIREQLNHRLFNGALGPELLAWLNQLPEVLEVLTEFFDASPINKQNLSEWRQGGYEDWLRHQERELRIQRIAEEGARLEEREGPADLYENSGRIAVAELMADLDTLHELDGEARWNRLRGLTRELARLQNGYNRSRWAVLAWTKWNDRFLGPEDYEYETDEPAEPQNCATPAPSEPLLVAPSTPPKPEAVKPNQTKSTGGEPAKEIPADHRPSANQKTLTQEQLDQRVWITRIIYHPKGCSCVCRNCHPENSEYPHAEALKDATEAKQRGALCFSRGLTYIITEPTECNCSCETCKTPKSSGPLRSLSPLSPITPHSDFLRQAAHRKLAYG